MANKKTTTKAVEAEVKEVVETPVEFKDTETVETPVEVKEEVVEKKTVSTPASKKVVKDEVDYIHGQYLFR